MNGQIGTIVELDRQDALGWIELDEGGRVRFGGTALKGFSDDPGVGTRVEVFGTAPGYKGVPKAILVKPMVTLEQINAARGGGAPGRRAGPLADLRPRAPALERRRRGLRALPAARAPAHAA